VRNFGQVRSRLWYHPDFKSMGTDAQLLLLFIDTGPLSNSIGCYRLPDALIMDQFGWTQERVSKAYRNGFDRGFLLRGKDGWTLSRHLYEQFPAANANVGKNIEKQFDEIPKWSGLVKHLADILLACPQNLSKPFLNRIETLSKGYRNQEQEKEQEQEQEQEGEVGSDSQPPVCDQPPLSLDTAPPVFEIPMTGSKVHPITAEDIERWRGLYPAVDIEQSIRNLLGWLEGNSQKRPATTNGAKRRVTDWLKGDQDRGGARSARASPRKPPWEIEKERQKEAADRQAERTKEQTRELIREMREGAA